MTRFENGQSYRTKKDIKNISGDEAASIFRWNVEGGNLLWLARQKELVRIPEQNSSPSDSAHLL